MSRDDMVMEARMTDVCCESSPRRTMTLGEKRQQAADLRAQGMSYSQIGSFMGVNAIRARDFCRQYDRYSNLEPQLRIWFELSSQAITLLLTGKYGQKLGGEIKDRFPHILEIAVLYSRSELAHEETAVKPIVEEIDVWLQSKGLSFRQRGDIASVKTIEAGAIAPLHLGTTHGRNEVSRAGV